MTRGSLQRLFLLWVRPAAPLLALLAYLVVWIVAPSSRASHLMELLVASIALALAYRVALRWFTPAQVLAVGLTADTVLVGLLTLASGEPGEVSLAYFWSIALAGWLLGTRATMVNTLVACVCGAALPLLGGFDLSGIALVTIVLVIALIGSMIALLSSAAERAEQELAREQNLDAAVLRVVRRIGGTLDPQAILTGAVESIGEETGALRAIARRVGDPAPVVWSRAGAPPYRTPGNAVALELVSEGDEVVIPSVAAARPPLARYMEENGVRWLVAKPVIWEGKVTAAFGIHGVEADPWPGRTDAILGRVAGHVAAALAQAEARDRAQELTRLREELIANVSHELRTPLTSTIGFLQTLEREDVVLPESQRRELLRVARQEAQRLGVLVRDLLEFSTLDRGGLTVDPQPVDVARLAEQVRDTARGEIVVTADGEAHAHADAGRIVQLLRNLVENALRHGAGTVRVACRKTGDRVVVEVTDEGRGVAPENESSLFVPFARWSERSDSHGLGLAIARRIARAHGGELVYRAAANGHPHAFVVELPAA